MTKVQLIEDQIQYLDKQSFAALRNRFIEYEHSRWDHQIATDSDAGKLDFLIDESLPEDIRTLADKIINYSKAIHCSHHYISRR